ncbi:MAG: DMT family transporter [Bacteroidales bacterium]|jgi:drug/metabolite transporter (DMT)-like permease|nr:DMT family transporter [Bacteroidales bacterium]
MRYIHFLLLIVSFIWGTSFVATEIALRECSVVTLLILRLGTATVIFTICLLLRMNWKKNVNQKDIFSFFLIGTLGVSLYQFLQITANQLSNASITSFFISMHPILLTLFGFLFHKEKITKFKILGIAFGFVGTIFIATNGKFNFSSNINYLLAFLCLFANSAMWASYSSLSKKMAQRYMPFDLTALTTVIGFLFLLPLIPVINESNILLEIKEFSFSTYLAIGYLSFFCTIFAYVLWLYCLKKMEISNAGYYLYLEPVFTISVAPLFLSNQLTRFLIIGGIMIFTGLICIHVKSKK